MKSELLTVGST